VRLLLQQHLLPLLLLLPWRLLSLQLLPQPALVTVLLWLLLVLLLLLLVTVMLAVHPLPGG
jgi:hypothetical protein